MKPSLMSATVGWIAGALTFAVAMGLLDGVPLSNWFGYLFVGALFGYPIILLIWLVVLWPLYVLVPKSSILWSPVLCTGCGCVSGSALYYLLIQSVFGLPADAVGLFAHLSVGAVVGAVTCFVGYSLKFHEHQKACPA